MQPNPSNQHHYSTGPSSLEPTTKDRNHPLKSCIFKQAEFNGAMSHGQNGIIIIYDNSSSNNITAPPAASKAPCLASHRLEKYVDIGTSILLLRYYCPSTTAATSSDTITGNQRCSTLSSEHLEPISYILQNYHSTTQPLPLRTYNINNETTNATTDGDEDL